MIKPIQEATENNKVEVSSNPLSSSNSSKPKTSSSLPQCIDNRVKLKRMPFKSINRERATSNRDYESLFLMGKHTLN